MNKYFLAILVIWFLSQPSFAQKSKLDSLYNLPLDQRSDLSDSLYYELSLQYGYVHTSLFAWVENDDTTTSIPTNAAIYSTNILKKGIQIWIPDNYQIVYPNGNKFIKAYLFNFSDSTISIPRIDDTVDNMVDAFKVGNRWRKVRKSYPSSCGGSYWTQKLPPGNQLKMSIENDGFGRGTIPVEYKIIYVHAGKTYSSNSIYLLLNKYQIDTIKNYHKTKKKIH